jgi:hypothetical protein
MRLFETSRDFMDFRIFNETSKDFQTLLDFNAEVSAVSP